MFLVHINVLFAQFSTNGLPLYSMTYLTYKVSAIDGKSHSVRLYYDNTAEVSECVWRVSGEHVMGVCVWRVSGEHVVGVCVEGEW